jgi:hypothetical protein
MLHHRLSAYGFKVIDLFDFPLFRFGVVVGALFVVFRAVPSGLILGGDPNPDAD